MILYLYCSGGQPRDSQVGRERHYAYWDEPLSTTQRHWRDAVTFPANLDGLTSGSDFSLGGCEERIHDHMLILVPPSG